MIYHTDLKKAILYIITLLSSFLFISCYKTAENKAQKLSFNTDYKENSPYFLTINKTLFYHSDNPKGIGGEDIWFSKQNKFTGRWSEPINTGSVINTQYHEYSPYLSKNGLQLYFTSDRPGGFGGYDIWFSERDTLKSDWMTPRNMGDSINTFYDEAYPCISDDGLTFFFSDYFRGINRKGGCGSSDIWISKRFSPTAEWEKSENAGEVINTEYVEHYPRLSADMLRLYFTSDRKEGRGGLDIWYSIRESENSAWQKPINLGPPVNSNFNDNGLFPIGKSGQFFIASGRNKPAGDLDIYLIKTNF